MTKHELTADNLDVETNEAGEVLIEPSFVGYLREHGYPIDSVKNAVTVQRKDSDTAHMVYQIETLSKPTSHPESDIVNDQITLSCCDCWNFRNSTPDVGDGETLETQPSCPHVRKAYKELSAMQDDQQDTLKYD